jgi:hypothetical protein
MTTADTILALDIDKCKSVACMATLTRYAVNL